MNDLGFLDEMFYENQEVDIKQSNSDNIVICNDPHVELNPDEVLYSLLSTKGNNKGKFRVSKPPIEYYKIEEGTRLYNEPHFKDGCVAYIWRMIGFNLGLTHQLTCMPWGADFDLPYFCFPKEIRMEKRKEIMDNCEKVVDAILAKIPKEQWRGVLRWGTAMGMIR